MSNLSEKLNFEEIEQALTSIWHAYEQVWQMFENGEQLQFRNKEISVRTRSH